MNNNLNVQSASNDMKMYCRICGKGQQITTAFSVNISLPKCCGQFMVIDGSSIDERR